MKPGELGRCCACNGKRNVRNIILLSYKAPKEAVSKWGCFQCGLPFEGAAAVICDDCLDSNAEIKYIMKEGKSRLPVSACEPKQPFDHDPAKHPGEEV